MIHSAGCGHWGLCYCRGVSRKGEGVVVGMSVEYAIQSHCLLARHHFHTVDRRQSYESWRSLNCCVVQICCGCVPETRNCAIIRTS